VRSHGWDARPRSDRSTEGRGGRHGDRDQGWVGQPGIISEVSIRNLFLTVLSARIAAGIEAESRSWILRCHACGDERSYWDAGGIRYKASGSPRTAMTCPRCRRRRMHDVFRRTS